eukprot:CAMPEP_0174342214 /NCGR_PEP_ID=MMETSP0810-20121108/25995_1 /TAXON_ID=73025 ORGANISM="Eutreptiella gymnastica-like, Strain CCMP1594" /NCGR_SAMPLE_ID=MMETSP0810 /ASSEMBLY_ACC=CAM_ASM_000659 /LENGTH=60 /DNA_ID=CAMNT_0015464241 /DNA_START=18 /DNA_END=197 /DNA_ORIENTATION=+
MRCHALKATSEHREEHTVSASSGPPTHQHQICRTCLPCYKPKGEEMVTPKNRAKLKEVTG